MQWLRNAAALLLLVLLAGFLQTAAASSQHQQASTTVRKSSTDEPGIARFLRDDKGVSIIEFSGKYGIDLPAPAETVGKEFFRTHADVYDFLVVFSSFEYPTASADGENALAFHRGVRNDTAGIGIKQFDNSQAYGSKGVLQSYIDMAATSRWTSATSSADYESMLSTFAHEMQHRWASHVKFRDWNGQISSGLLGKDGSHWSYLLESHGSVLYGASWRDNGDGSFTATDAESTFSPLDLYLAGLIDKTKVPPFFLIEAPDIDANALPPPVGTTIRGIKRIVTIDDIIAAEGPRVPSADVSQKTFRFGFIYLVRPGETINPADLDVVVQARRQVGLRYNALTHGLGTANVFAEPPNTTSPGVPGTTLPPGVPGTGNPGNNAAGLSWLKAQQRSDGSFMDAAGLAPRDTLLARAYLRTADPAHSGLGPAGAWIAARQLGNTDFLARRLIESTAGERRAEDVSALLAARNGDGGWGLGERLRSNPLDTALAIQALRLANADEGVIRPAVDLLLSWQNLDGGWGNAAASPSRVHVSAQALKALAGLANAQPSIAKARPFLKSRQNADGGFGDGASSIHDTAHASMAMGAAGFGSEIDLSAAQRFVAENQRMDGSWQGSVYNTVLALQMLRSAATANLAIGNLQASPLPIFDGQRVTLSARVVNAGSLQSQASTVRFFDGDPAAGGVAIGAPIPIAALVGGDGTTVQATWNTTSRAGPRTVFAVVDFEQLTSDLSRQDNITSLQLMVESANPLADLLLGDGDVLATPSTVSTLPATIQIDALVSNAGMAAVRQAKAVLWSGTGATRVRVAETTFDLAARATTALQFKPTLSEPGTTVYTVELDPDGLLKEASRANNSSSATVRTAGGVSLAVSKADISLNPVAPRPGADAMFAVRLRNAGTLDSASFNVRYSIRSGAGTTALMTNVVQIAAGSAVEQQIPWRAGPGGDYSFIVEMDSEKKSGDSDASDNTAVLDFKVAAKAGLNLVVSYRDLAFSPSPALEGSVMALNALVRNVGDVDASGFDVEFFDGDPAAGGISVGATRVASLAAGASTTATVNWEVPTASERLIFAVIDPKRSQPEEITLEDNVAFTSLKVLTLPDFAVSQGALTLSPAQPQSGEATRLAVIVSNLGEQLASDVVFSLFNGNRDQGIKLAPDVVLPRLAGKATATVQFAFNAPAMADTASFTVVVNPDFAIKERVRDNNVATITLGAQSGNFSLSEKIISPNGDGTKDSTVMTYRLPTAMPVTVQVMDDKGRALRTGRPRDSGPIGSWQWDGLDDDGRLVQDGMYELTVRNADGMALGSDTVEVDTNRSPLLAAIGTPMGMSAALTCGIWQMPTDLVPIGNGEGFFLAYPWDWETDRPAGIYRSDEWGHNLRLVMRGLSDSNGTMWGKFVSNAQGTKIVGQNLVNSPQLVIFGGEGEGIRGIPTDDVFRLKGLVNNDSEVLVETSRDGLVTIDIVNGQRTLVIPGAKEARVSPDRMRFIALGNEISLANLSNHTVRELPPAENYYWSPNGLFLMGNTEKSWLIFDANGNFFNEIKIPEDIGLTVGWDRRLMNVWAEDSSEFYIPTAAKCRDLGDGYSVECEATIQRVNISSGKRSEIASFKNVFDSRSEQLDISFVYRVIPGRYELLVSALKPGDERGDYDKTYIVDLRSPHAVSEMIFDGNPHRPYWQDQPPDFNWKDNWFVEQGRAISYEGSLPASCNRYGGGRKVFRSMANLQTDLVLSRRGDGVSVKIQGGVADKNFARYWLEYASDEAPDVWHPIIPPSTTAVWDKDLAIWVTPGSGRYTVRLTAEDLAGNRRQKLRRIAISQSGPPITNILREPDFISPNGDGIRDEMKLSYRVLESVNLEFRIFNRQGTLVRSISRNHPAGGMDAALFWDGRDDNGFVVMDGEYRINVAGFDLFVNVDNSAPVIHVLKSGPPFYTHSTRPARSTELRWSVSDTNMESIQLEVGDGAFPTRWSPYQGDQKRISNLNGGGAVYLSLADYVGRRYRLAVVDLAGNRTVAQFDPPQPEVKLLLAGGILGRDLEDDEDPPSPTMHGVMENRPLLDLRPSAGVAMIFAETLNEPIVAVSVQFNEDVLAQKGEWLEKAVDKVYPINNGQQVPYVHNNGLDGNELKIFWVADRSELDSNVGIPQNYGLVGFFNKNIASDRGMRLRLKLTGKSGSQYLTNEIFVQDTHSIGMDGSISDDSMLAGGVYLKTSRAARKLEVFISSLNDPYFSVERRIYTQELNSIVPDGSVFSFSREGRYVSCANYKLRAVATLDNGQELGATRVVSSCGGVEFKARPDFSTCGKNAPHRMQGFATPIPGKSSDVPLLSMEVYAEHSNGSRQLIFNVVNPTYQDYEFTFDHGALPEGQVTLKGITTDRDGIKRSGFFVVPVDHTPATLRITYPQQNQRVCAVPELHKRGVGIADTIVNALRPVVEIDDAAGFDYLQEFQPGDGSNEASWEPVAGSLSSLVFPDPRDDSRRFSVAWPYTLKEFAKPSNAQQERPYMSRQRIAGPLGPIVNISGQVTTRVTTYDWSGAMACRQVSFYLDGTVEVGAASVDQRLFSPGTSSSLGSVALAINPMEPLSVTVLVRRVIVNGDRWYLETGTVRRLVAGLAVPAGQREFVWDGKDDTGNHVSDGYYTFDIQYEDSCGNLEAPSPGNDLDGPRSKLMVEVDRTAPEVRLDRPLAGDVTSSFLDILGSTKDKNLRHWVLDYSVEKAPGAWMLLASNTRGVDPNMLLATLNATSLEGMVTLRLRAVDKVELESELTRDLRLKPRTELIRKFAVSPSPFSPNGDGRRDALHIVQDMFQPAAVDVDIKRDGVTVRHLLAQSSAMPGEKTVTWNGLDDASKPVPDGVYTVELRATSKADQTNVQVEEKTVLLDGTPPLFTLDSVLNPFMPGNAAFIASLSDRSLSGYQVHIEGPLPGTRRLLLAEGSETFTKMPLGMLSQLGLDDGLYRITAQASDEAENAASFQTPVFELDSKVPAVSFSNPAPGTFVSRVRPADISGLLDDRNLFSAELKIGDKSVFAPPVSSSPAVLIFPFDGAAFADGSHAMQLIGTDKAGNVGLANAGINVDNTPPVALITSPAANAPIGTMVPVVGTASDANMESWKLELGSGVGQNLQSLTIIGRGAGNVVNAELARLAGLPPDGPATLRLTVVDKGGNATVADVPLQIDATPPQAPVLAGQREQRNAVRLSWLPVGDASRIVGYHLYRNDVRVNPQPLASLEHLDAGLVDGTYSYTVTALSRGGAESARSNVFTIAVKAAGPLAQISKPAANAAVGGLVSIEGSAYAPVNFRAYQVTVGEGGSPTAWKELRTSPLPVRGDVLATWSTAGLAEGTAYRLRLVAEDIEGGVSTAEVDVTIDNRPPAKPLGLRAQLSGLNDVRVDWTASTETDLAGYLLYRDGQLLNQTNPSDSSIRPYLLDGTTYLDKALPDGRFVYTVVAVDKADNQSRPSDPASVTVDNRAPQAVIVEPANGASVDGVVYVKAQSPDTDIASVRFQFKAAAEAAWTDIGSASTKLPYSVDWDTKALANGNYQLRAVATDLGGRTDAAPPAITVLRKNLRRPEAPSELTTRVDGGDVHLNWKASASSDVRGYHVERIDPKATQEQDRVTRLTTAPVAVTTFMDAGRPDGSHQYQVLAVNQDDNASDPSSAATARVYTLLLKQPYTPVARAQSPLAGSSSQGPGSVELVVETQAGERTSLSLTPDAQGKFGVDAVPLAMGANTLSARQTDAAGNRSKAASARVARGDLPAAPATVTAVASGSVYQATWAASTSADVAGYVVQLDGKPSAKPLEFVRATASTSEDSYYVPDLALDSDEATAWKPYRLDLRPSMELELAQKQLLSEVSVVWNGSAGMEPPAYYAVEAWDGFVWAPLKEETANTSKRLHLVLDPPYYTDRLRIVLAAVSDAGSAGSRSVSDVKAMSLPVVPGTSAEVAAPDGVHTVSVRTLSALGLLGEPASASPGGIGDFTPPPPVVASVDLTGNLATVGWTESVASDLASYEVLRNGVVIATVPAGEPRRLVDGPLDNGRYAYTVRPLDQAGNVGQLSNEAVAVVAVERPGTPVQLSLEAPAGGGELRLKWLAPSSGPAAASYAVYRTTTAGGPYSLLGATEVGTLAYVDGTVLQRVRYYYVVRARNAAGIEGASSNEVNGSVQPQVMAPVIFHPTDSSHPMEVGQDTTAVRAFGEPAVRMALSRDGVAVGTVTALAALKSSFVTSLPLDDLVPAPRADLVAAVSYDKIGLLRASPLLDGSISEANVRVISEVSRWTRLVWSPDASRLALTHASDRTKVLRMADGSSTDSAFDAPVLAMAWHPDGERWIASINNGMELVEVDADSGTSRRIATASSGFSRLAISPEGRNVAVVDGDELLLLSLADSHITPLGRGAGPLAWTADGQSLYFLGWGAASLLKQVYRQPLGQSLPVAVTAQPDGVGDFALSPVGRLAFLSGTRLHTLDTEGAVSLLADLQVPVSAEGMRWAASGALFVNHGSAGGKAFMVPGTAIFPPVQLKSGLNLLRAQSTDASGRTGPPSQAISVTYGAAPVARPDFSVQAGDLSVLPQVPRVGAPARITLVVNNTGKAVAPGASVRMLAMSPGGSRIELLNTRTAVMSEGGSQVFRADAVFNAAGDWQVSVVVDAEDEVPELSEDNNVLVLPVRVVDATSERSLSIGVSESVYQVGSVLAGRVQLFNGQGDAAGQLKLTIEDGQGYVVASLPVLNQPPLSYGESRDVDFNWTIPGVFDAPYKVRAVWTDGGKTVAQATAGFLVKPRVQISARINSDSSSYPSGTAARIVAQIDPAGTSPTASLAQASIRVLDAGGAAVLEVTDSIGLVSATQLVKTLGTAGLTVGAYKAELRVSVDKREMAYASTVFEITAAADPIAALAGDIVLDRTSAPYTGTVSGTAVLTNTGETDLGNLRYEVTVIDPRTNTVLARSAKDIASLARGAQAREGFSFPATGMPMGTLWIQLRTSWVAARGMGLNAQSDLQPTLLRQREVSLFELDPPTVVIQQPASGAYLRAAQSVLAGATDLLSGVRNVEFQLDGRAWQGMTLSDPVSAGYAGVLPALADGAHQLSVRATDHSGNVSQPVQRSFVVDSLPPAIAISGVAQSAYASPVTPSIVVTDLNLSVTHIRLDGSPYVSGTPVSQTGSHVLQVDAIDLAGNTASRTVRFSIQSTAGDTTAPVIDIRTPSAGAYLRRATTGLTAAIVDAESAVAEAQFSIDGGTFAPLAVDASQSNANLYAASLDALADGVHSVVVRARDTQGNEATTDALSFTVDNTPPVITISGVAAGQYAAAVTPVIGITDLALLGSSITLNGSAYASGTPVAANGDYTLSVEAVDKAGNGATASLQFSIRLPVADTTPPAVFIDQPAEGAHVRRAAVLSVAATDSGSGVASVEHRLDGQPQWSSLALSPTTGKHTLDVGDLPDGAHAASVRATDNAGNVSDVQVRRFTVDNTAPQVVVTGVAEDGRYTGSASAAIAVSDTHLANSSIMLNGQPYVSGSPVGTPGTYVLTAAARDIAGNETVVTIRFQVTAGSGGAPAVTITAPAANAVVRSGVPVLATVVPVANISRLEMAVAAGASYTAMASRGSGAHEAILAQLADGPVLLRVRAVDSQGVSHTDVVRTVTVDNTPPAIEQLSVAVGGRYPAGQTISFKVVDAHLESVASTLDGQPFSQGQRVSRPGSHVLQITARDRAGNQAQRTVVFTVLGTAVQEPVAVPAWPSDRAMLVLMCLAMAFVAHRALGKTRKK